MNRKPNFLNVLVSVLVGMTLLLSAAQPNLVSASTEYAGGEGVRASVHPQTGKLSFLGADPSSPIRVDTAMRADLSAEGRGLAILDVYGPQFGLKNAQEELRLTSTREADGRGTTKYQQMYQGVPVMAGELIVNTNAQGGLLSINGEVSPDLDISVTPSIGAMQAQNVALQEIASAYGLDLNDLTASDPELWVYDARLMNGDDKTPAHLVWRMEITAANALLRELVLVNAQSGEISLHFNQIEKANIDANSSFVPNVPDSIIAISGGSQSTYINAPFANQFVAQVLDNGGNPVSGVDVTFSAPTTGASGLFSDADKKFTTIATDINGYATAPIFFANKVAGTYTVNATVSGVAIPAGFQSTNLPLDCYTVDLPVKDYSFYYPGKRIVCDYGTLRMRGIGSGDFNNDGLADVAVLGSNLTSNYASLLLVFLQKTNHTLPDPVVYYAGSGEELAVGDVNNDGLDDVVVDARDESAIAVFLQLSNKTLGKRILYTGASKPNALAIGDVNNDGLNDVVFSNADPSIGVLTQAADGILNPVAVYPADKDSGGYNDIDIGDVNGDGLNDVVRLNGQGYLRFLVYFQKADGTLNPFVAHSYSGVSKNWPAWGLGVGDITGDGRDDVILSVSANTPNSKILVYKQSEIGKLLAPKVYGVFDIPQPLELVDINLDGKLDLVTAHGGFMYLGVMLQRQNGTLDPDLRYQTSYNSWYKPSSLSSGDINSDGWPDILLSDNEGFAVYYHDGYVPTTAGHHNIYNANNRYGLPGSFLCDELIPICSNGYVTDADQALGLTRDLWDFFFETHGRKSYDGLDSPIVASVNYGNRYHNAFWDNNRKQLVFGASYIVDDLAGHEFTHGVTQSEANLFNWYQSGAISESFSDLWGEMFDQFGHVTASDTPSYKWYIGEDISGGPIRSMKNPTLYDQPDSMTSELYCKSGECLRTDNGGIHINSGVNNKAAYLMINGGTFNGKTVIGLGWSKTLAIYYEVQTNLLTSGADYLDLYNALYQACLNKVGTNGIIKSNCAQVKNATLAVKMDQPPIANFNPDVAFCPAGNKRSTPDLFYEDFETGTDGWTLGKISGTSAWAISSLNATSGISSLWANDRYGSSNSFAYTDRITLPAGSKPYLHFRHSFKFETSASTYFDGGILEYSINNGGTWNDASSLFSAGKGYGGEIKTNNGNPLGGRSAFVDDSHGFVDSRYDLTTLAGKTVRFRWRMGTDNAGIGIGWYLDDVRVYACVSSSSPLTP